MLVLQDGTTYKGRVLGFPKGACGEVVFNTGMVGYTEALTDPSYSGQILVLTYPLVGNYGVPPDFESEKIHAAGLVVTELAEQYSHARALKSLPRWLYEQNKPFTVDFVLGATMMVKAEVIEKVGMLDEQFFMYCEEIDWAWRMQKAGWLTQCVPTAHVTHLAGQSSDQVRPQSLLRLWSSRLLPSRNHYPRWKRFLARRLIALGMRRRARRETNAELRQVYQQIREMALLKIPLTYSITSSEN